jgi:biopolymer transport protein ExbD
MRFQTQRPDLPSFNLTPLIDILFIVLIFLVLTTTFRDAATFRVNLPPAETSERDVRSQPDTVTVSVAEDGTMEIDGEESNIDHLSELLAAFAEPDRPAVRLRADAGARHGLVVQIMDVARRYGITQLDIETRPSAAERRQD